jgi:tartrate dehydrogenase/decarboxylase / D-malate dehydrogenase
MMRWMGLAGADAIYFGAVGWPEVPDHISLWGLRLAICQGFDQYACVRPVKLLPGIESPLRNATSDNCRLGRRARER